MPTIKELREGKGWTQEKLAQESSVSIGTINRVEQRGLANRTTIKLIALALGVQPGEIDVTVVNRVSKSG